MEFPWVNNGKEIPNDRITIKQGIFQGIATIIKESNTEIPLARSEEFPWDGLKLHKKFAEIPWAGLKFNKNLRKFHRGG